MQQLPEGAFHLGLRVVLTEQSKYAPDEAGIRIPYPQMDMHFDKKDLAN